jgi:hypothetical protein
MTFRNGPDLAAPCGKSRRQHVPTEVQRGLQDGPRDRKGNTRPVKTTKVVRSLSLRGVAPSLSPAPGASGRVNSVDDAQNDLRNDIPPVYACKKVGQGPGTSPSVLLIAIRPRMYEPAFYRVTAA